MDKPTGTLLIMVPCWWGLAAAQSDVFLYLLFALGSFVMRSFGCIVNDWVDCDIDKKVHRTMNRPIANGSVSINLVKVFLATHLTVGFSIWLYLNNFSKIIALVGLLLCLIYPWMKRITNWPQLVLGFAFNIGILVAYSQYRGYLTADIWLLYLSGICWTLSYDTVYAFQDYKDDLLIGIGSTTRIAAYNPKLFISFWMALCLTSFGTWCYFVKQTNPVQIAVFISLCITTAYNIWQWNANNLASCSSFFKKHALYGWMILLIILAK